MEWLIDGLEPNVSAVFSTYGTKTEAVMGVIQREFYPTGKLLVAIPANDDAVNKEVRDVPSFAEKEYPNYAYMNRGGDKYEYGFGLSYNQGKAIGKPDPCR